VHLREEIVVQEGAQASNVHHSSRAWGIPHPNFVLSDIVGPIILRSHLAHIAIVGVYLSFDLFFCWIRAELPQRLTLAYWR